MTSVNKFFRIFCVCALIATLQINTISPAFAQPKPTMWETFQYMMGWKEREIGPQNTLVAPFAAKDVKPFKTREEVALPVNAVPLHVPHRSNREISSWLSQAVMSSLELDKEKIKNINAELDPYFTTDAREQFKEFGQKSNVFSTVFYGEGRQLISYGKSTPVLIRAEPSRIPANKVAMYTGEKYKTKENNVPQGSIEDIQSLREQSDNSVLLYQWVFQVPATLSLLNRPIETYDKETPVSETQTQRDITFCVTVSRSPLNAADGVLISNWQVGNCS